MPAILIIDDDRIQRVSGKAAIETRMADCICYTAGSAVEGLELAKKLNPHCILLDIILREENGYQTLTTLKSHPLTKQIPVILISGIKNDTKSRIKAMELGADGFLSKPCDYDELVALIKVMFRIKETEEKLSAQLGQSRLKYKEVVDLQQNGVAIYDVINDGKDFVFAEFNAAAEKLEQINRQDVIGKNVLAVFPGAKEFGILEVFKNVYKTGHAQIHPVTFYSGEGVQGWRENYIYKISSGQIVSIYSDVSDRKKREENLRQSELKYRLIADYNYAWEYWKNKDGNYNYVSPSCFKASGYTSAQFIENKNLIVEITHPDCQEKVLMHNREEELKIGEHQFEFRIIRPDGTERWLLHKCRPIYTEDGEFLGRRGINKDITEYKKAIESLELLNKAINSSKDVVFVTDTKRVFTYVNEQFCKFYGYEKDEVVGKLTPNILDSGTLPKEKHNRYFEKLLQKERVYIEYANKCKNGKIKYVDALADPIINSKGEITGFLAIQRDISERKRADLVQKIILHISDEANKQKDLEKLFKFVKKEMAQVIDSSNCYIAIYDEISQKIQILFIGGKEKDIKAFQPGKTLTNWVLRNKKSLVANTAVQNKLKEKGEIELVGLPAAIWLGVPLKVEGKVIGVFAFQNYEDPKAFSPEDLEFIEIIANQISYPIERFQKEETLLKALERAQESDRLKSAFLASMSHELRTPLNAVIGYSSLFDRDMDWDDVIDFADKINTGGNNLLAIVDDIFALSLLESRVEVAQYNTFSVNDLLNQIYKQVQNLQKRKEKQHLEIVMNPIPANCSDLMESDRERIRQIFIRLLSNAVKFTLSGSVVFGAECKQTNNSREWHFYVKDTGIGIPNHHLKFIFDRFRMGDDSHTRQFDGLGLGLSIAKLLTDLLGGKIGVESKENYGSKFYFDLTDRLPQHAKMIENLQ